MCAASWTLIFFEVSRVQLIHRQRHVEEHAWAKLRGLTGLYVVHDRFHIHDHHDLFLARHGRKGNEVVALLTWPLPSSITVPKRVPPSVSRQFSHKPKPAPEAYSGYQ